jgi:magnesium transporter
LANEKFTLISYDPDIIESYKSDSLDEVLTQVRDDRISCIIVHGFGTSDEGDIQRLLSNFSADPALSEKILNQTPFEFTDQLPNNLYFEFDTPIPFFDAGSERYLETRGSLVLGERFLLLFDESMLGVFDEIQQKILSGHTRAQSFGSDYLLYLLFRTIISHTEHLMLGELVNQFNELEGKILTNPDTKKSFNELMPARELVKALNVPLRRKKDFLISIREQDIPFITPEVQHLFACNLAVDLESLWQDYLHLRDWWDVMLNIYHAKVGQRTNRIIYILTFLSAVFLPLPYINSVADTRFKPIPGIDLTFGLYGMLLIMTGVVAALIWVMKKLEWL